MPDNRELAILFWVVVALCWILGQPKLRSGVGAAARALFQHPFLYFSLAAMGGYMAVEVWVGARLGVWNRGLLTETAMWATLTGGVMFFESNRAAREPHFFRKVLSETVAVAVFLEFFMNAFVMSLPAELIVQPVIASLVMVRAFAGTNSDHRQVRQFLDIILALIGLAFFGYTAWRIYIDWATLDVQQLGLELLLPIWLTIGLLPFVYVLSLVITYDSALRGIAWAARDGSSRWRAWLAVAVGLHLRHRDVVAFNRIWTKRLVQAQSFGAARRVIREFRCERRAALRVIAEEEDRVKRYAGSDETDHEGRRYDRREFEATIDALRWMGMAQINWYRNHGNRYSKDLLTIIGDSFRGLPEKSGIMLVVSDDAQSWYAWRRSVTGWCFAIGAGGPPPDHWEFDGPDPPQGFPGREPAWGDAPFAGERNRNWH